MKILGIETSCDETAVAIVEDGVRLLSNVVSSQIKDFEAYGGVIPEMAARSHIEIMLPLVTQALEQADSTWDDIDAIGVTYAPGLIGSLMIGALTARTLAHLKHKPLYAVHHVEGHVYANFLTKVQEGRGKREERRSSQTALAKSPDGFPPEHLVNPKFQANSLDSAKPKAIADSAADNVSLPEISRRETNRSGGNLSGLEGLQLPTNQPKFPLLALIVSGGHTQLALFRAHGDYVLLGQAQDDAVGEAFDKVAKIIGLPYPGGVSISKLAPEGDAHAFDFPRAHLACPPGCLHELNKPVSAEADPRSIIRGGRGEIFARDRCHRYDFSFSGLKTAVLRAVQAECGVDHTFPSHQLPGRVSARLKTNVAASFQRTAVETLVEKTLLAYHDYSPASVVIAGGVAANQQLRRHLSEALPIPIEYAPMSLCTDNAAMIASLAYFMAQSVEPADPLSLEVVPSLSMTKTRWKRDGESGKI